MVDDVDPDLGVVGVTEHEAEHATEQSPVFGFTTLWYMRKVGKCRSRHIDGEIAVAPLGSCSERPLSVATTFAPPASCQPATLPSKLPSGAST